MPKTVLIADDEVRMRKLIVDFLIREDYAVLEAENGQTALHLMDRQKIDLLILDVMMPVYDGWTVCREIRKTSNVPIIMLTAKSEEIDQLFGFEIGADEYITKPFSPRVLTARVNALFNRLECKPSLDFGSLKIDTAARCVSVDSSRLDLSPKEYELLMFLVENRGQALSREQILNGVWNYDYLGDLRTVDTHINRLRTKLGAQSCRIQTIRSFGYRFEVEK